MATPINSFQQQRAALMASGSGLDPALAQAVNTGIAALTGNAEQAAKQFSMVGQPSQATSLAAITPENIAQLSPETIQQYMSQMPAQMMQQSQITPQATQAMANFGSATTDQPQTVTGGGTFAELLNRTEGAGSYDTLFGHSQRAGGRFAGVRPSQMTIGQMLEFQNPSGEYGQWVKSELAKSGQNARVATPAGAGQIVGSTLRNASKAMGLSPDTPFNANTQNSIINYLAQQRLKGANSIDQARSALRSEWEGFKNVSNHELDRAITQLGFQFR